MSTTPLIRSSYMGWVFFVVWGGAILYVVSVIKIVGAEGITARTVLGFMAGAIIPYALYITSCSYEVHERYIVRKILFGLLGERTFLFRMLKRGSWSTDYTGSMSSLVLEFEGGSKVRLTRYQRNFFKIVEFLRWNYGDKID